jgi:hypothetical protein
VATPAGWRVFRRWCAGETTFDEAIRFRPIRAALAVLR